MGQRVLAPFSLGQGMSIQINPFKQSKWMMIMLIYFAITFATQLLALIQVTVRGPHLLWAMSLFKNKICAGSACEFMLRRNYVPGVHSFKFGMLGKKEKLYLCPLVTVTGLCLWQVKKKRTTKHTLNYKSLYVESKATQASSAPWGRALPRKGGRAKLTTTAHKLYSVLLQHDVEM